MILLFLNACVNYKEVVYNGIQNVQLKKIDSKGKITIQVSVNVYNPNDYDIKIKPSKLNLLIASQSIGLVKSQESIVLLKNSTQTHSVDLEGQIKLKDNKNILQELIQVLIKNNFTLRVKGKLKISVKGLSVRLPIDETPKIKLPIKPYK
jgi:LEA14-like dessication related protein